VLVLVENSLAVRANMKVIKDIMDPAVQLVWLHYSHHVIDSGGRTATLGAFVLGSIYREWTPLLNRSESSQRLEILLLQICKATEHSARVLVHGYFNLDLDRSNTGGYYVGAMLKSLADCTTPSGLETNHTGPTFRSFSSFRCPAKGRDRPLTGDPLRPAGDSPSPAGDSLRSAESGLSPAGDDSVNNHKHSLLDHVYTKDLFLSRWC
jgi:hypothetical protein